MLNNAKFRVYVAGSKGLSQLALFLEQDVL